MLEEGGRRGWLMVVAVVMLTSSTNVCRARDWLDCWSLITGHPAVGNGTEGRVVFKPAEPPIAIFKTATSTSIIIIMKEEKSKRIFSGKKLTYH